jgi:hypothetical protein
MRGAKTVALQTVIVSEPAQPGAERSKPAKPSLLADC